MTVPTPINADALRSVMAWWEDSGVDVPTVKVPKASQRAKTKSGQARPSDAKLSASKPVANPAQAKPVMSMDDKTAAIIQSVTAIAGAAPTLEALKTAVEAFDAGDLSANANQAVFARGNPEASIMVIGEAPGKEEDAAGKPFMGPAGQLLDRMLASIDLGATDVYITNVCNWRPLNNRSPNPQELELCRPFIKRHIELAKPKFIILVGGVSLEAMIGIKGIMKTHGQWQSYEVEGLSDVPAMPIYHPAFLLRRPELKRDTWHDLLTFKVRLQDI